MVYDLGEFIPGKSTTIILDNKKTDLRFLQAILNSKLISFWYQIYFSSLSLSGGYLRISGNELKQVPIPTCDSKTCQKIINLVDKINSGQKHTPELEDQIDELIFNLYDLTEEEKEIIRNS